MYFGAGNLSETLISNSTNVGTSEQFDVIGIITGVLKIIQAILEIVKLGSKTAPKPKLGWTVRVAMGLDIPGGLQDAGGQIPTIRLYNERGNEIGHFMHPSSNKHIGLISDGETRDIHIEPSPRNSGLDHQQATYALFTADIMSTCIAYVSLTWADGTQFSFDGGWGRWCGARWYYSNMYGGGSNKNGEKGYCLWLDSDKTPGSEGRVMETAFKVHFPTFAARDNHAANPQKNNISADYICQDYHEAFEMFTDRDHSSLGRIYSLDGADLDIPNAVRFPSVPSEKRMGNFAASDIDYDKMKMRHGPAKKKKRSRAETDHKFVDAITLDHRLKPAAEALCNDPNSAGPSYANFWERKFCRMEDRKLFPFCEESMGSKMDNCFVHTKNHESYVIEKGKHMKRSVPYAKVYDWIN